MQADFVASAQLVGSFVLIGVTAWYAWLTRSLAKSARNSAASSAEAAASAARSVAAAVAALSVEFEVTPTYTINETQAIGVSVKCVGSTVYLHRAHLIAAYRSRAIIPEHGENFELVARDLALEPATTLPQRLHNGEAIEFTTKPPTANLHWAQKVASQEVMVWYSLEGEGEGTERRVAWRGVAGRDYAHPGSEVPPDLLFPPGAIPRLENGPES